MGAERDRAEQMVCDYRGVVGLVVGANPSQKSLLAADSKPLFADVFRRVRSLDPVKNEHFLSGGGRKDSHKLGYLAVAAPRSTTRPLAGDRAAFEEGYVRSTQISQVKTPIGGNLSPDATFKYPVANIVFMVHLDGANPST